MVAIFSSGRNNPNDYVLGRGAAYFAPHKIAGVALSFENLPLNGYRDLGNLIEFKVNQEIQTLEHFLSRNAVKFADKQVIIQEKMSLGVKLDEINADNLALWFAGTAQDRTTYAGAAIVGATDNITPGAVLLSGGYWYDIFKATAGGAITGYRYDDRLYDLGATTVTAAGVVVTPVEGVDYIMDYKMGRIFIVKAGNIDNVVGQTVALNVAAGTAGTITQVNAFNGTPLRGSLKFIQVNPANAGQLREYEFHSVQLKPQGTFDLIGDGWQELELTGVAEANPLASAGSAVCTIRTYPLAQGAII